MDGVCLGKGVAQGRRDILGNLGAPTEEGSPDRLGENSPIKVGVLAQEPEIEKILHPCIGFPEGNHGFEFFGHHRIDWVGSEFRGIEIEQGWEIDVFRIRGHMIPEADINLHVNLGIFQSGTEGNSDARVGCCFPDAFRLDRVTMKDQSIRLYLKITKFSEDPFKGGFIIIAVTEQIDVAGRTVHVFKPEGEKRRTLEKEPVSIGGTAETVEEPLNGIAGENAVKGLLQGRRGLPIYRNIFTLPRSSVSRPSC